MNLEEFIGLGYSGNLEEQGTIADRVKHASDLRIPYIQLPSKMKDSITDLKASISDYKGNISIHLPSPKWEEDSLSLATEKNQFVQEFVKWMSSLGINLGTIHPSFNYVRYLGLDDISKKRVLNELSEYFASLSSEGITLAIENLPDRDLKKISEMEDGPTKDKNLKSISICQNMQELKEIVELTRQKLQANYGVSASESEKLVGVTYDTGHSLMQKSGIDEKLATIDEWIEFFAKDIRIFHVTPSIIGKKEANIGLTTAISDRVQKNVIKYGIEGVPMCVEAHDSLDLMEEVHLINKRNAERNDRVGADGIIR